MNCSVHLCWKVWAHGSYKGSDHVECTRRCLETAFSYPSLWRYKTSYHVHIFPQVNDFGGWGKLLSYIRLDIAWYMIEVVARSCCHKRNRWSLEMNITFIRIVCIFINVKLFPLIFLTWNNWITYTLYIFQRSLFFLSKLMIGLWGRSMHVLSCSAMLVLLNLSVSCSVFSFH